MVAHGTEVTDDPFEAGEDQFFISRSCLTTPADQGQMRGRSEVNGESDFQRSVDQS
jgi:hypothetical protein